MVKTKNPIVGEVYACKEGCRSCSMSPMENEPIRAAKQFLHYNKVVLGNKNIGIDIGAHMGLYGMALSNEVDKMHSFEIEDASFTALENNSKNYPQIIPYKKAAWDVNTEIGVVNDREHGGGGSMSFSFDTIETNEEYKKTMRSKVQAVRLDDCLPDDLVINFLKLDIEGAEIKALEGMEKIISRSPNIMLVIEYCIQHLDLYYQKKPQEFFDIINSYGFTLTGNLTEDQLLTTQYDLIHNLIFIKE